MRHDLFGWTIAATAFVAMLVIHELGHYIAARIAGVPVKAVSLGFGRELFGFTDRRATRWKLSALPLGGYVLMDEALDARPLRVRLGVMAAGPGANFLLAAILLPLLFAGVGERVSNTVVTDVLPASPAARAGIAPGDRILALGDKGTVQFADIDAALDDQPATPLRVFLLSDGVAKSVIVLPRPVVIRHRIGPDRTVSRIGLWQKRWPGMPPDALVQFLPVSPGVALGHTARRLVIGVARPFIAAWRAVNEVSADPLAAREPKREPGEVERTTGILLAMRHYTAVDASYFLAFGSVSFGIFNLFPFPPMDGWNIGAYLVGAVRSRRTRQRD